MLNMRSSVSSISEWAFSFPNDCRPIELIAALMKACKEAQMPVYEYSHEDDQVTLSNSDSHAEHNRECSFDCMGTWLGDPFNKAYQKIQCCPIDL